VALVPPPVVVTVTSTVPRPVGAGTVMELALFTVNGVAGLAGPKFTPVTPLKFVPVIVTDVPPVVVPEVGLSPVTVGGGGGAAT